MAYVEKARYDVEGPVGAEAPVLRAVDRLEKAVGLAQEVGERYEARLQGVVAQAPPEPERPSAVRPSDGESMLARRLDLITEGLDAATGRLVRLLERLEV